MVIPELQSISYIRAEQILNIKSMAAAVDSMHSRVAKARTRKREESIRAHNKRTNIQQVQFEVGEFVLVGNVLSQSGSKLNVKWKGPYRVVRIMNEFVSIVEGLVNGKEMEVNNSRLKFYSDSELNITEELLKTISHYEPHYETITKMLGLRFNSETGNCEVQCRWRNFSHEEPTLEPISNLHIDGPEMLDRFLKKHTNRKLVRQALDSLK